MSLTNKETKSSFSRRKLEHIEASLLPENEAFGMSGLERVQLIHNALPEINFEEIQINSTAIGINLDNPFLVSSMTAGHAKGTAINHAIAAACEQTGWLMGVGSQRRQLFDESAREEWIELRKLFPNVKIIGNIGVAQLITTPIDRIREILQPIKAHGIFIHANPLQEAIQVEGTPNYQGGFAAINTLASQLEIPVILKETGCGFAKHTLQTLNKTSIAAVDISGFGGTHWGRIEGCRANSNPHKIAASTFANWGISTLDSIMHAKELDLNYEIWGSGGIRNGLDAAKVLALGANIVGFAKPILEKAIISADALVEFMRQIEFELKIALFATGCKNLQEFKSRDNIWQINPK